MKTTKTRVRNSVLSFVLCAGFGVAGSGCGSNPGLTQKGSLSQTFFARQRVRPDTFEAPWAVQGLDSQEAAIISSSYRKSLAPKGSEKSADQPVLLLAPEASDKPKAGGR